ncbi:MAG: glycosyltransferase [Bacteroidales bacterium]|nr:glycosyltransferase [Bacteroidales bacterium]
MRVLMFGWEFPPHITGGLGTACYGLTKALSVFDDLKVTFVVPKAFGDEDKSVANFVNAEEIGVDKKTIENKHSLTKGKSYTTGKKLLDYISGSLSEDIFDKIRYIEISSLLQPYISPQEFEEKFGGDKLSKKNFTLTPDGRVIVTFEGKEIEIHVPTSLQIETDSKIHFRFSGTYGASLISEVSNYALVAAELAKNEEFDLIHAHDWLTYPSGVAAKKISGKKLVIHVHATEFDRSGESVNQVVYDIERYGMTNADLIITVSNLTRETVINKYGIPDHKVVVVHNGVLPKEEVQHLYTKNVKEKIVTFLGRITFQKGPEYFIEAAYKVLQKTKDVKFVMAGSGDLLYRMINRAAELKIADKFHFTNFLKGNDVDHMFSISDVYVMPSVSEPFGISPLEAMRSNVPVIISKQSGVAEVLKHAIKVDFWDIDAMADAIYGIITYGALSKMFKRLGKHEVEEIKWDNAASKIRNLYSELLS